MNARLAGSIAQGLPLLLAITLLGCGGRGFGFDAALPQGAGFVGPLPDPAAMQFPGLPALPDAKTDTPGPRRVSEKDNIQLGNEDWQHGGPGADYSDTNLVLYGPSGEFGAWGIWQWSGFTGGLVPNSVTVDATLDPGRSYWLLVSNYSTGRWQIVQEVSTKTCTYNFEPGYNYTSPGHSVYVALIADRDNTALINELNLRADLDLDAPAPPRNLQADSITSHQAHISWDANTDADVLGYRLYSGPDSNFAPGDPGVTLIAPGLTYLDTDYLSKNLSSNTLFHYKLTAYDTAFNESEPSEVCEFTTLVNTAPVPDFSWSPGFVQVDREVLFDPTATTDLGDVVADLLFEWDFENDGTVDAQTTGPDIMPHTYSQRRTWHCRLRVSDFETGAQIVKDVQVSFRYDYHVTGLAGGHPASLAGASTDPQGSRIVVGVNSAAGAGLHYYHDGSWELLALGQLPGDYIAAVALGEQTIAALTVTVNYNSQGLSESLEWYLSEYASGGWTQVAEVHSTDDGFASGAIACSPAGRYAVALVTGVRTGLVLDWTMYSYHETAAGGWNETSVHFGVDTLYPYALERDDTSTFVAYAISGVDLVRVDDSSDASTHEQDCAAAVSIIMEESTQTPGELSWVVAEEGGSLVWGDNFGQPNSSDQLYSPPEIAEIVMGMHPEGDNECQFYWKSTDPTGAGHIRGYSSTADSGAGAAYELGSGYELATLGFGGSFEEGAESGIYFATQESRDGEIIGYFVNNGTVLRNDVIYEPSGITAVQGVSAAIIFPDGSLTVLHQQPFPTAVRSHASTLDAQFSQDFCGDNNFLIPTTACASGNGGEFLTGSISDSMHLVLNRFDADAVTGDETLVIPDAARAVLRRNAASEEILLAYTQDQGQSLYTRSWNGMDWDSAELVAAYSNLTMQMALAPRADGGWGLAYALDNDELWLAQNHGSGWAAPELTNGLPLNDYAGLGLGFSPAGGIALVSERSSGSKGVWMGIKASGELSFGWQLMETTDGNRARNCNVFYDQGEPVVFYYYRDAANLASSIRVFEKIDGSYDKAQFDFIFYDVPLGTAVDENGNIVFSGVFGNPPQSAYVVIWR